MSSVRSYPVFTLFDSFWKTIFGTSANDFVYKQGETFLSNPEQVLALCVGYLVVIFGGQKLMKSYKPIQFTFLFQIHNVFLTFASGLLLALFVEELYYINREIGPLKTLCSAQGYTSRMDLFYYLNYLTKYYEFIDTFFLVMKKKDLQFLHWYHHSMTAALCYINITSRTSATWVVVTLNLFVHVFMYYYYFLTTLNVRVWWKKYITVMQITQFVIDLVVVFSGTYTFFAFNYYPSLPNFGHCSTTRFSSIFSCSLLTSYLVLFIQFFFKSYSKKASVPKEKKAQ